MTIAAIWAVGRLVEPVADAAASFNIAVAWRGVGALLAALAIAAAMRRLGAQPSGRARIAAERRLGSPQNARLGRRVDHFRRRGDRLHRLRHFPRQSGDLPQRPRRRPPHRRHHRPGRNRGRPQARRRRSARVSWRWRVFAATSLAQIVVILQGVARVVVLMVAVAAVLKPWGVQSQDMFGSLRSAYFGFSLGGVTLSLSSMIGAAIVFAVAIFLHPADPELAELPALAADASRLRRAATRSGRFSAMSASSSPRSWPARKSASMFRNSR